MGRRVSRLLVGPAGGPPAIRQRLHHIPRGAFSRGMSSRIRPARRGPADFHVLRRHCCGVAAAAAAAVVGVQPLLAGLRPKQQRGEADGNGAGREAEGGNP